MTILQVCEINFIDTTAELRCGSSVYIHHAYTYMSFNKIYKTISLFIFLLFVNDFRQGHC